MINNKQRQVQENAWQQIIRVLSHKIRNSLTPIRSMTELILDTPKLNENLLKPLEVIESRSTNLLQFVERYADSAKPIQVTKKVLNASTLVEKILPLFPQNSVETRCRNHTLLVDPVLIEQARTRSWTQSLQENYRATRR